MAKLGVKIQFDSVYCQGENTNIKGEDILCQNVQSRKQMQLHY